MAYALLAQDAEALDRAALSAGVDLTKTPRARVLLDDELNAPVGRAAEGFDALRKFLGKG